MIDNKFVHYVIIIQDDYPSPSVGCGIFKECHVKNFYLLPPTCQFGVTTFNYILHMCNTRPL